MDPSALPLHVADFSPAGRVAVSAVAGLLAATVMNVPIHRLPEGSAPPFVAAGALTGEGPTDVNPVLASGTHYAAGVLVGMAHTLLALGIEGAYPFTTQVMSTGLLLVPHLLAGLVTYAVLVVVFAYLVLPVFGGSVRERARLVRRDWVLTAGAYTLGLTVLLPVLLALV